MNNQVQNNDASTSGNVFICQIKLNVCEIITTHSFMCSLLKIILLSPLSKITLGPQGCKCASCLKSKL